jgi:hypothetical protein
MKKKLELFLFNQSKADVSISDLGVKVPAGKVINVYKYNPYLTAEQVNKSLKEGALNKRLNAKNSPIKIVKKDIKENALTKIKQSNEAYKIKKTKSSVVIEYSQEESNNGEKFDFADYGVDEVSRVKDQASVLVKAKEDILQEQKSNISTAPKLETSISKQSTIVMETMTKNVSNPIGKIAENANKSSAPYVVSKQPAENIEPKLEQKSAVKIAKEENSIMVGAKRDTTKSNKKFNTVKRKNESDPTVLEEIKLEDKAPVKNDRGLVVMEIKEKSKK